MARLRTREFRTQDALGVAALHARAYPQASWISEAACAAYFREVLLHNPWRDAALPSWVVEDGERIVGFYGVMPRRMRFGSRALRVAVGCQLMVDPEHRRSFAALELMKRFLSGPQDLSLADGANDASRRCWEACGGFASPLHSLHWVRLLRPARGLLRLAAERPGLRALSAVGAPLAALADACAAGISRTRPPSALREEPLEPASLAEAIREHRGAFTLRPDYDAGELDWLLAQSRRKRRHGELHGALLRERTGRAAGWFLYYLGDGLARVLSAGAGREHMAGHLDALFEHALARGAAAIEGRLEPHLAAALKGRRCLLQNRGIATLLHARDPALLVPFLRGDVLCTRLEGECWTRFNGEPAPLVAGEGPAAHEARSAPAYPAR